MKLFSKDSSQKAEKPDRLAKNAGLKSDIDENVTTRTGVYVFSLCVFAVCFAVVLGIGWALRADMRVVLVIAILLSLLAVSAIRVCPQWEKVSILRFGKFHRIAGPGLYVVIPFAEYVAIHIDHRIITSSFSAEAALTADLVPVDVDAILFWLVWDARKACLEVQNYPKAVILSAQTAIRDAIGQTNLADLATRRKRIDHELQKLIGEKCEAWGITVISVEIRDIFIPLELQNALSKEAQAEKERDARIILAEIEKDISDMYVEAAETYEKHPQAMKLRAMNLAYESSREGKGVLLVPSSLAEGFDLRDVFEK